TASFADRDAGTGKTVTVDNIALSGTDAGNYTIAAGETTTADIFRKIIDGTVTADDKTYDGLTDAVVHGTIDTGDVIAGDTVALGSTGEFADKNAGTDKAVDVSDALVGADAGNYVLVADDTVTADILQKAITGTLTADDKTYDGTTGAVVHGTLDTADIVGGDIVALQGSGSFEDKNAGTGKTVDVTGTLSGDDAGNYDLASVNATTTADIAQATLTLADLLAWDRTYDGSTDATVTADLAGLFGADAVDAAFTASFADRDAGTGKTVTVDNIALSGTDAGNYTIAAGETTTADIFRKVIDGTVTADDKTYDGLTDAVVHGTIDTGDVIAGDNVALGSTGEFADKNAGTDKTVDVSSDLTGTDAGNYVLIADDVVTADITAKAITVNAAATDKVYDGSASTMATLASDGVIAGDAIDFGYATATFNDKNVGTGKTVTVDGIAASGADAGNYSFNTTATTVADIGKLAIVVAAAGTDKTYDGTTADTVTLSSNGVLAGDDVAFTGAGAFADKSAGDDKPVSVTGISADGDDAGNYSFNTTAATTADISKRAITVEATGTDRTYDGTTADTVSLVGDGVLVGDAVSFTGAGAFADSDAGEDKPVSVTGIVASGSDAGNYSFDVTATTAADIAPAMLTYVATPTNGYSGLSLPPLTGTVEGFVGGDTLASATDGNLQWTSNSTAGSPPGNYAIDGSGLTARNYLFVQAPGNASALTLAVPEVPPSVHNAVASLLGTAGSNGLPGTAGNGVQTWPGFVADEENDGAGNGMYVLSGANVQVVGGGIRLP
ncbi:MAG TPA: YDG domain-containing protein, partial [Rhodanobacteraceae bacterium]|nr:YDG domain-containing protein [Rhodanobacteraceae bacterium]